MTSASLLQSFYSCRPWPLVKGAHPGPSKTSVARQDPLTGALEKVLHLHARQITAKARMRTLDESDLEDELLDAFEHAAALHLSNADSAEPRGYSGCLVEQVSHFMNRPLERIAGHSESQRVDLALLKVHQHTENTTMQKTTFTKELKAPAPAPASTISLSKALKLRPVHATRGDLTESAGLIKALHRSGGEPLRKAVADGPLEPPSDDSRLEKSAAPALIDGMLDPSVQARLDREVVAAAVKARLRQPGTAMGWRRAQ